MNDRRERYGQGYGSGNRRDDSRADRRDRGFGDGYAAGGRRESRGDGYDIASPRRQREQYGAPERNAGERSMGDGYGSRGGRRYDVPGRSGRDGRYDRSGTAGNKPAVNIVGAAILCAMVLCSGFFLPAGAKLKDTSPVSSRDMTLDIYSISDSIQSRALTDSGLYQMKRTKALQWNEEPAPAPVYENFSVTNGDDGRASEWSYQDETITVKGWTEHIANSKVYFSDVTIAHPSQLRTALANGSFPSSAYPSDMAKSMNAVIAANGDFSGYRESGMIIRQGVCYRAKQYEKLTWDVLLIDDQGNFHITDDRHIDAGSFRDCVYSEGGVDYNIVNTFHFGPSLVVNGEKCILHMQSGCGNTVNETYKRSHTAIGQLGPLHYLICCVEETDDGMKPASFGTNIPTMADIMYSKNCVQAYNLDGGQSTTLVFGGNTINFVNRGGERELSEIVYFASAENLG